LYADYLNHKLCVIEWTTNVGLVVDRDLFPGMILGNVVLIIPLLMNISWKCVPEEYYKQHVMLIFEINHHIQNYVISDRNCFLEEATSFICGILNTAVNNRRVCSG